MKSRETHSSLIHEILVWNQKWNVMICLYHAAQFLAVFWLPVSAWRNTFCCCPIFIKWTHLIDVTWNTIYSITFATHPQFSFQIGEQSYNFLLWLLCWSINFLYFTIHSGCPFYLRFLCTVFSESVIYSFFSDSLILKSLCFNTFHYRSTVNAIPNPVLFNYVLCVLFDELFNTQSWATGFSWTISAWIYFFVWWLGTMRAYSNICKHWSRKGDSTPRSWSEPVDICSLVSVLWDAWLDRARDRTIALKPALVHPKNLVLPEWWGHWIHFLPTLVEKKFTICWIRGGSYNNKYLDVKSVRTFLDRGCLNRHNQMGIFFIPSYVRRRLHSKEARFPFCIITYPWYASILLSNMCRRLGEPVPDSCEQT